jgi:hypothetical protein
MRVRSCGGDEPVPIGAVLANLMARIDQGQVQHRHLQDYETVTTTPLEI